MRIISASYKYDPSVVTDNNYNQTYAAVYSLDFSLPRFKCMPIFIEIYVRGQHNFSGLCYNIFTLIL